MNKGQITSAVGKIKEAFKLFGEANKMLRENGIGICGLSLKGEYKYENDEVQLFDGIDILADTYGKGLMENGNRRIVYFMIGNTKYFELIREDGTHR